uniref:Protein EFR3 homolog cmp44Elike [Nasonia vitripennis] n=1 Tax=Lepeophtheirus salmonis TaxID=72036 RepID=A0A0K2TRT0_LEPSM
MSGFCGCCSPLKPRFKRLVDDIFPPVAEDGLVKSKMETLTYYAATSPEKLDRIGEYLAYRIGRDISRQRQGFVLIGMEAMDALLKSCHAQSLNLYVESFLKTVQRLLESPEPELEILASESFLKFSQIEEDTPSYHRTYDFFVDRFSQMCHAENVEFQERLRTSGLLGLNGVIRKTVNEDLAENIWDPKHMDKIIPSLLYNIHTNKEEDSSSAALLESQTPSKMADQLLRELVKATSFSTIKSVLLPVLVHVDNHRLWEEHNQTRAVQVFEAIMYSIQPDLSYIVIDRLMGHLDTTSAAKKKSQIASVLAKIIGIGVGDSTVGPSVLEIINALLKHLKKQTNGNTGGGGAFYVQQYHHALLTALGEYVSRLPDFQMVEIMTFILSKVPSHEANASDQQLLQIMLKALYCVAEKYTSKYFTTTFSPQFLSPLLRILSSPDQEVRLMVLQILQTLVDRHDNLEKLSKPSLRPANLGLNGLSHKFNRADQMFTQKTLFHVYNTFKKVLEESNSNEVLEYMYTTVALLVMETSNSDDGTVYLLDLIVCIQNIASINLALSSENRFALHALAISLLALLASTVNIAELDAYVDRLIDARERRAIHMLPPFTEDYHPGLDPNTPDESLLIKEETIKEALTNAGKNLQKMDSLPRRQNSPHNYLWHENTIGDAQSRRVSTVSLISSGLDVDSTSSSPGIEKKPFNEEVSVAAFRKVLEGPTSKEKEEEEKIQKELKERFLNDSFDNILEFATEDSPPLHDALQNILNRVSLFSEAKKSDHDIYSIMKDPAPYEKIFPELFMY